MYIVNPVFANLFDWKAELETLFDMSTHVKDLFDIKSPCIYGFDIEKLIHVIQVQLNQRDKWNLLWVRAMSIMTAPSPLHYSICIRVATSCFLYHVHATIILRLLCFHV